MAVTNKELIFSARMELLASGRLKIGENGLPEEIHTFQGWKSRGFSVKKGQKSDIHVTIWKMGKKKDPESEDGYKNKMFMKNAAFFSPDQVERLAMA